MATIFQQYYTKSNEIVSYMIQQLSIKPGSTVLEPCAGDGVFVDALLNLNININIDAFELDPKEANNLKIKYRDNKNVNVINEDTLLYRPFINNKVKYDYIIANPPYGAWQDYKKRDELKNIYANLYIKETYSTFLYLCLSLLSEKGKLVFINPDTYLNLHRHTYLRKYLLHNSIIEEISIFPSSFFPGVNFGYSKLSIITLIKSKDDKKIKNNEIRIRDDFKNPSDLIVYDKIEQPIKIIKQKEIIDNIDYAFYISDDLFLNELLKHSNSRIGDIAYCVTGIYTGNDKEFIKVKDHSVKNGKNYKLISDNEIYNNNESPSLSGITSGAQYIPIIKGGNIRYYKNNIWFINWSKEAINHYKHDKKSRFQNSQFYFKSGIAVPMVSSNNVTASLIDNRLFDQSIVGIFPKEEKNLLYLLGFFNSTICTKLLRLINPSANNSANYIKKIPIIIPNLEIHNYINELVKLILENLHKNSSNALLEKELDDIFTEIYSKNIELNSNKNIVL